MNIAKTIDHAVLKPTQTDLDLRKECAIAHEYKVASICVKPNHVLLAKSMLLEIGSFIPVGTVINFPNGMDTIETQKFQIEQAVCDGAKELDIVINIAAVLSGNYQLIKSDLRKIYYMLKSERPDILTKVILEICYLNKEQIVNTCEIAKDSGVDFVKTSTGFGPYGATIEAVKIMKDTVGDSVGIKASGGIKDLKTALEYIELGCSRIGTSATENIIKEMEKRNGNI